MQVAAARRIVLACLAFAWLPSAVASAAAALLPDDACVIVRKHVARRDNLPETGPPGLGWFCDVTPSKDSRLLIVALRTQRPNPYDNLVGWYAVDRASRTLYKWSVKEQRTQPIAGAAGSR